MNQRRRRGGYCGIVLMTVLLACICLFPLVTQKADAECSRHEILYEAASAESLAQRDNQSITYAQAVCYHTYNVYSATCTVKKYCTKCGYVAQKALGHDTKYSVTKQATCTTQGTYQYKCTRCSYTTGGYFSAPNNHTYNVSAATCTVKKYCTSCGKVAQNALGHNTTYSVTKQATCTTQGTYVYKCTRCSYSTGGYISSLGHDPGAAATCTTAQTCKRCSAVVKNALGHDPGAAATCTTAQTCKRCSTVIKNALGHDPGAAATCTTAQTCKRCSAVIKNALGHNPGAAATCTTAQTCTRCAVVIQKALGHNTTYTETKQATCTTQGTYVYKCTRCSYSTGGYISSLGHNPGAAATCTTAQTCKRCSEVLQSALGHTPKWTITVAPSCKGSGTEECTCDVCKTRLDVRSIQYYGGHKWCLVSIVGAQGSSEGSETYQCAVCDATKTESHNYEWETTAPHDCMPGKQEYKCTKCGYVRGGRSIQAYGNHTWQLRERDDQNCTCVCEICGLIVTREHYFRTTVTKQPTSTSEGEVCYVCAFCEYSYTESMLTIKDISEIGSAETSYEDQSVVIIGGNDYRDPNTTYLGIPTNAARVDVYYDRLNKQAELFTNGISKYIYDQLSYNEVLEYMDEVSFFLYTGHGASSGCYLDIDDKIHISQYSVDGMDLSNLDVASVLVCYSAGDCENRSHSEIDQYAVKSYCSDKGYEGSVAYALCQQGAKVSIGCNVSIDHALGCNWEEAFVKHYPEIVSASKEVAAECRDEFVRQASMALAMSITDKLCPMDPNNDNFKYRDTIVVFVRDEDGNVSANRICDVYSEYEKGEHFWIPEYPELSEFSDFLTERKLSFQ